MIVTAEQARIRFATLPPMLQSAVFSVQNAEIIGRVAEQNHIPEEKISDIAESSGLVLLGFIHPEELPQEISERAGIPLQTAKSISDSLANRIFNPLKDVLDQIYAPVMHPHEVAEPPKVFEEIKKTGVTVEEVFSGSVRPTTITPIPLPKPTLPTKPGEPVDEFEKMRMIGVNKSAISITRPPSAASSGGVSAFAAYSAEAASAAKAGKTSAVGKPLADRPSEKEPPPVIIHEETRAASPSSVSGFKIETPLPKLSDIKIGESPRKPAIIEFGVPPKPPAPPPPSLQKTRITSTNSTQTAPSFVDLIRNEKMPAANGKTLAEKLVGITSSPLKPPGDAKSAGNAPTSKAPQAHETEARPPRVVHYSEFRTPLDKTVPGKIPTPMKKVEQKVVGPVEPAVNLLKPKTMPSQTGNIPSAPTQQPPRPHIEPPEIKRPEPPAPLQQKPQQ